MGLAAGLVSGGDEGTACTAGARGVAFTTDAPDADIDGVIGGTVGAGADLVVGAWRGAAGAGTVDAFGSGFGSGGGIDGAGATGGIAASRGPQLCRPKINPTRRQSAAALT